MPPTSPARRGGANDVLALVGFLILCFAVAAIGGWATASSVDTWFQTLSKPSFNPPDWVFGPVWTVLYFLMALAAWRVQRHVPTPARRMALAAFYVQLALNLAWSLIFFGLQRIDLAAACILLLWLAIMITIVLFRRVDRWAPWLLLPYLAWVTFASVLNFAIGRLN